MFLAPDLVNLFTYHAPQPGQIKRYERLRVAGRALAEEIVACVPFGADQTAAIRKVREAIMTANAGIACGEAPAEERSPVLPPVVR
jgi:hypothetical protein